MKEMTYCTDAIAGCRFAGEYIKFAFYRGPPRCNSVNFLVNNDGIIQSFEMGPEPESEEEHPHT